MGSTPNTTKAALAVSGQAVMVQFCELNKIDVPTVEYHTVDKWPFDVCGYYRPTTINICVPKCAGIGVSGAAWSFPGHVVDRTPYGVITHELGHHVDVQRGRVVDRYRSDFSRQMRQEVGEPKLTNYCPDDGEWFAEIFRLFVTNPDLLRGVRPRSYAALIERGLKPLWADDWESLLAGAPDRTIALCRRRIEAGV
ncbi:hypothetical protein MCW82_07165 [Azospirillum doebereinerae]|uniref:hypothetical protein n=1 Tax=Azospirillum doebereinerae TaxID=92933 RepID=UPI001EE5A654|nr:hypothetical protein [Azospirillum doebereinerae]MCG5239547.1 hypothetical protein [Azospirillum doebereinerae]